MTPDEQLAILRELADLRLRFERTHDACVSESDELSVWTRRAAEAMDQRDALVKENAELRSELARIRGEAP